MWYGKYTTFLSGTSLEFNLIDKKVKWTILHALTGNNSYKHVYKRLIWERSRKCTNGLFVRNELQK